MSRSFTLAVSISDSITAAHIPAAVQSQLGVTDGDTIALNRGVGDDTVAVARGDDSVPTGQIVLPPDTASQLGVSGGESVTVRPADTATAGVVTVAPVPRLAIRSGEQLVRDALLGRPTSVGDTVSVSLFDGALDVPLRVISTTPSGPVVMAESTDIVIEDGPAPLQGVDTETPLPASAVGGYTSTIDSLCTAIRNVVGHHRETRDVSDRRAGLVIAGPHGVGKTQLLRHAASQTNTSLSRIGPQQLIDRGADSVTDNLRSAGTTAQESGGGVVHLDKADTVLSETSEATVAALREWVDQIHSVTGVGIVAEVTDTSALPVALTSGERLSTTVTVPEPTRADRAEILKTRARRADVDAAVDFSAIGQRAFGYVAADLVNLWLTAVEHAATRTDSSGSLTVMRGDMQAALESTEPAGMGSVSDEIPDVTFDDIGGLDEAKQALRRTVEWPLTRPELFEAVDIDAPAGLLLYGPPGTGKTLLARAVASTSDANFIAIDGPEIMDRYVGESERAVRRLFDRARANAPTILFFDEIDAIGTTRSSTETSQAAERVVSQLLTELDGIRRTNGVMVIGATNRPDLLDDALLRPGRFDRTIEVGMPDLQTREAIFRVHTASHALDDVHRRKLAERTDGYTGSDIAAVVREAGLLAIEEALETSPTRTANSAEIQVSYPHFKRALEQVDPSLTPAARRRYESIDRFE